jgi:capsule polysaccharide export protein KpsE/RkpR
MVVVLSASVIFLLLLPLSYKATTVLFPPKSDNILGIPSQLSLSKLSGSLFSQNDELDNKFIAIFNSRSLKEEVIKEFNLIKVYKFDKQKKYFFEDIVKEYNKHFFFNISDEGMMSIDVIDENAKRAAEMADYVSKKLDEMYRILMTESARNNRQFIGERLQIIKKDLSTCETELNGFQNKFSLVDIEGQTKATIEALAVIEAQLIDTKQKLENAKRIYNYKSPEIKQLELEIKTIQQQKYEFSKKKISEVFIPLDTVADLGLEYLKLKRNLLVQEKIFEFAMQQYEAAKFEEAKQTPNLLVLDPARVPDKRYKPKRTRLLIMSLSINAFFCFAIILLIEYWIGLKRNNYELHTRIVNLFKLNIK